MRAHRQAAQRPVCVAMSEEPDPRWRTADGISLPTPGVYDVDPVHTFVMFRVRHLVVGRVDGSFTSFQGQSARIPRGRSIASR